MKRLCLISVSLIIVILLLQTATAQTATVANHYATNLAVIPDAALIPASNLRMDLRRASVGGNISDGLDALQSENAKYNRSRWIFYNRGNPDWQTKVDEFVSFTIDSASNYDVLSMKFCFIDPTASFSYYRDKMLWLESNYSGKRFIWWTIPIETSGNTDRQSFNDSVRTYANANGKLLFDIADIESCDTSGVKQVDGSNCEIMRSEWTSDGGHLNAAGAQRVASAFWWLMAKIAGWDGTTGVDKSENVPIAYNIFQNYPNPFNPSTKIAFSVGTQCNVSLRIFDILGREITTLISGIQTAGEHTVEWNGKNSEGQSVASGMYFYQLRTNDGFISTKKMLMLK